MIEKKEILEKIVPKAVLQGLTSEANEAVSQNQEIDGFVCIREYPFRIGRESRVQLVKGKLQRVERPKMGKRQPNNELYLVDRGEFLNISREHLVIACSEDGKYSLHDRGSACGTIINGRSIGGKDSGGSVELTDGDEIIIGTQDSPYRFRFIDLLDFGDIDK